MLLSLIIAAHLFLWFQQHYQDLLKSNKVVQVKKKEKNFVIYIETTVNAQTP